MIGTDKDEKQKQRPGAKPTKNNELNHAGGISDDAGGVDPIADENLMRLSGGP